MYVTFSTSSLAPSAGIVKADRVYPLYRTMLELLADWHPLEPSGDSLALSEVKLHAPVLYPTAIYGSGANYYDHLNEMAAVMKTPAYDPKANGLPPWFFIKVPRNAIAGPGDVIQTPAYCKKLDWEVELAAVISRTAKDVSVERALDHVAGYTISNDLSARDHVRRPAAPPDTPFAYDWLSHKSWDGSCPLGPGIVPLADPQNLKIQLWLNSELMQDSSTSQMIYSVAEQIAFLSSRCTLHPGDVVLTGTPAGVGMARGKFLQPGDHLKLAIEHLGVLENTIA
ncbi:MAG TPA: fumarylacetoacetate hydrolase family protein [Kofleriaceae bacterium]